MLARSHILIWKHFPDEPPSGSNALLGWAEYELLPTGYFRKRGDHQVGILASNAVASMPYADLTVAWGGSDLWSTSASQLEAEFLRLLRLRPTTLIVPERRNSDQWIVTDCRSPTSSSLPTDAIPQLVSDTISTLYPMWEHVREWIASALLVRRYTSAEEMGLIKPEPLTGDRLLNAISADPKVREAMRREDLDLPETIYALARARLAAQEAMGIPLAERVVLFSGQAEDLLAPTLIQMDHDLMLTDHNAAMPGVRIHALAALRRRLRPYRDLANFVLTSALRDYPYPTPHLERLREAANATAATAA